MIYLDNNATTRPCEVALQAFLNTPFGNPHSTHKAGIEANIIVEKSKEVVASCINCEPEEVFFVSSATEACNWAIQIMLDKKCELKYNKYEHSAVLKPIMAHTALNQTERIGWIQMLVNNIYGEIYNMPTKENPNDIIFTDGTAGIGHIAFDFKKSGVDLLAFGAHKFNGLKGCGVLVIKKSLLPVRSFIWGGDITGGTPAPALIAACAMALQFNTKYLNEHYEHNLKLQKLIWNSLSDIPYVYLNGPKIGNNRATNNLNIGVENMIGTDIQRELSLKDICISTGSACSSDSFVEHRGGICPRPKDKNGEREPELITIFKAAGFTKPAEESIRITTDWMTTEEECKIFIKEFTEYIDFKHNSGLSSEIFGLKTFLF